MALRKLSYKIAIPLLQRRTNAWADKNGKEDFALFPSIYYLHYWSVRRLKASPTPPCGIFNINYQRQAGHSHHFVVVLSCLVMSEYQKVNKDD